MDRLQISSRLQRKAHGILLEGVRGEHKSPDEFRRSQNWFGGGSLKNAIIVPPSYGHIPGRMSDLENFSISVGSGVPNLIKIGIAQYQFETIQRMA